jgi:hypothetical protein
MGPFKKTVKQPRQPKTHVERAQEYAAQARAGLRALGVGTALSGTTTDVLLVHNMYATLAVYELLLAQIEDGNASAADGDQDDGEYSQKCQACGAVNMVQSSDDLCYSCGKRVGE